MCVSHRISRFFLIFGIIISQMKKERKKEKEKEKRSTDSPGRSRTEKTPWEENSLLSGFLNGGQQPLVLLRLPLAFAHRLHHGVMPPLPTFLLAAPGQGCCDGIPLDRSALLLLYFDPRSPRQWTDMSQGSIFGRATTL